MKDNYVFTQTPEEIQGILNKVPTIEQQVDGLQQNVGTLNETVGNLGESVTQLQETKVEKVEGKQLSTEDFTSEDKAKLDALPTNTELQSEYASQQEVGAIDERLEVVEQLGQISVEGGSIGIATPSDFDDPTPEQAAKVPTVGAILGCMDEVPTAGSDKPVKSSGVKAENDRLDKSVAGLHGVVDVIADVLGAEVNDYSAVETNKALKNDGLSYDANANFSVSDFIAIPTGATKLTIVSGARQGGSGYAYLCFYSSSSTSGFISAVATTGGIVSDKTVAIPSGATHIRVTLDGINHVVVGYNSPTEIDTIKDDVSDSKSVASVGVLPIQDGESKVYPLDNGCALLISGAVTTNNYTGNNGVTDFIPVSGDKVKIVSGVYQMGSASYPYIAFYDENKAKVSTISNPTFNVEITNTEIDVPSGAVYFKLCTRNGEPAILDYTGWIAREVAKIPQMQTDVEDVKSDVDVLNGLLGAGDGRKAECAVGGDGKILKGDGTAFGNAYTTAMGVSNFIAVAAGDSFILSGAYMGSTGYAYACFYTAADESSFLSKLTATIGNIDDVEVVVPAYAAYIRISLANKDVPASMSYSEPVDCVQLREDVELLQSQVSNLNNAALIGGQIYNPPLPIKGAEDELNILYIGSSYGVDTISALADICRSVGLKVNTADMYKSGATTAQYLDDVANNRTNVVYYNNFDGTTSSASKTVQALVTQKAWDIVCIEDASVRVATLTDGYNTDYVKWVSYLRGLCTNPRVVFAFNVTWVYANNLANQGKAYEQSYRLMRQSGINIAIPTGQALALLRQTNVNDGNNIYRDALHLDVGVGRFTAACALFFAVVNYAYGVGLDNCDLTGKWDTQGSPSSTNPTIEVTNANRQTCIDCARMSIGNRFGLPEIV